MRQLNTSIMIIDLFLSFDYFMRPLGSFVIPAILDFIFEIKSNEHLCVDFLEACIAEKLGMWDFALEVYSGTQAHWL